MQQVIITVEDGTPLVEVKCVKGADCKRLTRGLEAALGEVQETKTTPEFYERAKQTAKASR